MRLVILQCVLVLGFVAACADPVTNNAGAPPPVIIATPSEAPMASTAAGVGTLETLNVPASGGAIDTAAEAESLALAEIPESYYPKDPVARLLRARDVGRWLGSCLSWYGDNPYWLVGLHTEGQPPFSDEQDLPGGADFDDFEGVYRVFSANSGGLVAFGTLDGSSLTYHSISTLSSRDLTIAYKTPRTLEGSSAESDPMTISQATIEALPTAEAQCRATEWAP